MEKSGFFASHGDTLAIMAVNVAIGATCVMLYLSNTTSIDIMNAKTDLMFQNINSRVDAETARQTARSDKLYGIVIDLLKDKQEKHG